ncbi:MAG TPA: acyl-ACP thioesterase domain-containing protein [Candidatus Limnocylindrales bacterium]
MLDPGLTGQSDRPVAGIDNGFVAGYRVRFDEAGPDEAIRTSVLLRYSTDVAWRHSEALGFDRRWYLERGRWWVVRSVDLEVVAAVPLGRTLRVSTAVVGHHRIWARRLADARLGDGSLAARIVTDWVILDDRGRPVRIPEDFGLGFTSPELPGDILRVELPAWASEPASEIRFAVRPHDLDPMGHANNATYLDWIEEALLAAGREAGTAAAEPVAGLPRRARLVYLASAEPGDEIVVTTWRNGLAWASRVSRAGGPEVARAAGSSGPGSDASAAGIEGIPPLP